jgi:acetyltransferase-like isoleucine patch superfamily enzyme
MVRKLTTLLNEKGPVTLAAVAKRYLIDEIVKHVRDSRRNVSIHSSAEVAAEATFEADGEIIVHRDARIRKYAVIAPSGGQVEIGANTMINVFVTLLGHGSITLGRDVLIGPHTTIVAANHTFTDPDVPIVNQEISREGIVVQDDVWIGANCTILDGVTVGRGSIVAAGSVVTESVEENSIVAGAPAKPIGERGSSAQVTEA